MITDPDKPGNPPLQIEVKILDDRLAGWGFPRWGSDHAAGLDLHACIDGPMTIEAGSAPILVSAGIAIRIGQPGWCGIVAPRSGLGHRGLVLGNTVGVIDADYEGPILISAFNRTMGPDAAAIDVMPGDRIAQLVFVPIARPTFTVVTAFSGASGRGTGGFGSTGLAPGTKR